MSDTLAIEPRKSIAPPRNSSFEILRIIAILFIIAHHFAVHSGFDFSNLGSSPVILFNRTWVNFVAQLGKVGVNLFVLISAFFLSSKTAFKTRKVLFILFEMFFFSVIIKVAFFFVDQKEFSQDLIWALFPFGRNTWWFMTCYLLLYLLHPLLNLAIHHMPKKMHLFFIVLLFVLWSVLPTFLGADYGYTSLAWFILLYLAAAYVRIYDLSLKKPVWAIALACGVFLLVFFAKAGLIFLFGQENRVVQKLISWFSLVNINNSLQLLTTLVLFVAFKSIHTKPRKVVNFVASFTLSIYLFHDHPDVRNFLWIRLFHDADYASSPWLAPYSLGIVLAVFATGLGAGIVYRYTLGVGVQKLIHVLDQKWLFKIDQILSEPDTAENIG